MVQWRLHLVPAHLVLSQGLLAVSCSGLLLLQVVPDTS